MRRLAAGALVAALVAFAGPADPGAAQAGAPAVDGRTEQARSALTYELVDTWANLPHESVAGRFLAPLDITSAPDETVFVLGRPHGYGDPAPAATAGEAVHVIDRDGEPLGLFGVDSDFWAATRADGGPEGDVYVLGQLRQATRGTWGVARYQGDGQKVRELTLATAGTPSDIAVAFDGRIYVSMMSVSGGLDSIDVYEPDGALAERMVPSEMGRDGPDSRFTYDLTKLDIHPDGTIYVMASARRPCPTSPSRPVPPRPTATPKPTPTPRPSLLGGEGHAGDPSPGEPPSGAPGFGEPLAHEPGQGALMAAPPSPDEPQALAPVPDEPQAEPCYKQVVLVFEADHSYRDEVPNSHLSDIAAGASGVFVATSSPYLTPQQMVYRLGSRDATFIYRVPDKLDAGIAHSASFMQLDVAADGRVHATVSGGAPFYRGALTFGDPTGVLRPSEGDQQPLGVYDRPALAGPRHPVRLDAENDVYLYEAPYSSTTGGFPVDTHFEPVDNVGAVQRWSTARGEPVWQAAHHGNLTYDEPGAGRTYDSAGPLVDLAVDGDLVYAISGQVLWSRRDALPPDWYRRVGDAHFIGVAADAGQVAVLDGAARRVMIVSSTGRLRREWAVAVSGEKRLASDIAYADGRVYLSDQGRNRIMARDERGRDLGEWVTHDGPKRLTVGPEGDLYVLGRGGYGLRYTPDGVLVAAWRMPQWHDGFAVDAQDIGVGADGRVYVSFLGLADHDPAPDGSVPPGFRIDTAGVWVFAPVRVDDPPPPPDHSACLVEGGKRVSPDLLLLGEETTITLALDGLCPGRHAPQQLMIVLDTSYSMHDGYVRGGGPGGLTRAKDILSALLSSIDPGAIEIGLITFSGGAGIEVPLPGDLGEVRSRILSRVADGDTQMGVGIELARGELRGPKGDPTVKQTILVVSDGVFKDDPAPAIAAAHGDGIEVVALVTSTPEFDAAARARLVSVIGDPGRVFVDPVPESVAGLIDEVAAYIPNPGLFERVVIEDVVPANMRYVLGSAVPAAEWDEQSRTLTWALGVVLAADGPRLAYDVVPLEPGHHPTNVRADARYTDALGNDGWVRFNVPVVDVLAPFPLATMTASATPTPTATPTAPPTPTSATARTYRAYLPLAARRPVCISKVVHSDIVLVLDMSRSMERETASGRTKHEAAMAAAREFVRLLGSVASPGGGSQVAIVGFNDRAWVETDLTSDRVSQERAIERLPAQIRDGTRLDLALDAATAVLLGPARDPDNGATVVLLTDGLPNRVPTPAPSGGQEDTVLAAADRAKDTGATVVTIGLGRPTDIRAWMLRAAASDPTLYYETPDAEELEAIFALILERIVCGED